MDKFKWREERLYNTEFDAVVKQMEDFKKKYPEGKGFYLYSTDEGAYIECTSPMTPEELEAEQRKLQELETKEKAEYERLKKKYENPCAGFTREVK